MALNDRDEPDERGLRVMLHALADRRDAVAPATAEKPEPGELSRIARALPRWRLMLVAAIVVANLGAVTYSRGRAIGKQRLLHSFGVSVLNAELDAKVEAIVSFVPPWEWSADEWAETWPWR